MVMIPSQIDYMLNHKDNDTDWYSFGHKAETICKENGWSYYIKEDLREAMK